MVNKILGEEHGRRYFGVFYAGCCAGSGKS